MLGRLHRLIFGKAKDASDPHAYHQLSLIALLAWVGLGADGLSSSAYGPEEAFRQLGEHKGLAVLLAMAMAFTVFVISYAYSRIVEHFPSGGGGYVVASLLLGPRWGLLSGAALLVDYVLTITISIASGADAIFSFLPVEWAAYKFPVQAAGIGVLTLMNVRGVKESITPLVPVFMTFIVTHAIMLVGVVGTNLPNVPAVSAEVRTSVGSTLAGLGLFGTLKIFVRAYSLGGGTYTGIEAVSNGVGIMREPRVQTAKRTMLLMATSLAVTASGILLSYLLVHAEPETNKTMNAVLFERFAGSWTLGGVSVGHAFVILSLVSEGALLFVAAQTGFVDGPRVMANMALDSWLPHRFAALSDRLSMRNGVLLMGSAALAALFYTGGDVGRLVVMYSINVFVTFSLSQLGMSRFWIKHRADHAGAWLRHLPVHIVGFALCVTILAVTVVEKFGEGGWVTVAITSCVIALASFIKRHYDRVVAALRRLDQELPCPFGDAPAQAIATSPIGAADESAAATRSDSEPTPVSDHAPTAVSGSDVPTIVLFVGGYSGLGRHALLALLRMFPNHFANVVFVSIAVVDSGVFKGEGQLDELRARAEASLGQYERFARSLGLHAASAYAVGTEVIVEAERLGKELALHHPKAVFVAGQLIFDKDTFWNRTLHNETAFLIQRRLQHDGIPMIVLPVRLDLSARNAPTRLVERAAA